ncbi:MAG: 5-(carboxyamino)imidazole ribonucleotide mutase [Deltaproteobacteria bacterium]|nr:5-(carboxyamino)imidazole ribonucleotide mutase [Deltaproteobacteria bacterium]
MNGSGTPMVGILMGSASDLDVMSMAQKVLEEMGISSEVLIASAHRSPEKVREYALTARDRGIEVIVAGAGWAAHLAGVLAGWTDVPVIAVPIGSSPFQGLDALLSSVMMPPGVPVAVMAVNGAKNAALFSAQILAVKYPGIRERLGSYRRKQSEEAFARVSP